ESKLPTINRQNPATAGWHITFIGFLLCWYFFVRSAWNRSRLKNQSKTFILLFNSIQFDRYVADKPFVADVYSVSQHSRKPLLAELVTGSNLSFSVRRTTLEYQQLLCRKALLKLVYRIFYKNLRSRMFLQSDCCSLIR